MKDPRLTTKQIKKIFESNKYVLMTMRNGLTIGINCRLINCDRMKIHFTKSKMNWRTRYVSFKPCSINEYLNYKGYFIES